MREAAGAEVGDTVALEISPEEKAPEPKVPADLRKALAANPAAKATWTDITPVARRDWIAWIISGKKAETRVKRIDTACDKLASGMRRACCFDRSGMRSEEHTSELQSLMRTSYAVFCLKKNNNKECQDELLSDKSTKQ